MSSCSRTNLLLIASVLLSNGPTFAVLPAFPGAEGPGAEAGGGRSGKVFIVTNLNADGPGSLREAVSRPNRMVVFEVSGIIDLDGGKLELKQPNITIAGQSAPGEGICIKHGTLRISASNIVIRHLRIRRGKIEQGDAGDSLEINPKDPGYVKPKFQGTDKDKVSEKLADGAKLEPLRNIVLDHVSTSWATDENFTMSGHIDRVHAQYCLIAEALDYENPKQTPTRHAFGSLLGGAGSDTRVGMHHCIYAHHRRRTPQCSAGDGSGDPPVVVDFRNNTVYDSIEAFSHTGGHPIRLNFVNNYYKAGASTNDDIRGSWFTMQKSKATQLYADGNFVYGFPQASMDNWQGVLFDRKLEFAPEMKSAKAFETAFVTTQPAEEAHRICLRESGATLPARDAVDTRIVEQIANGTGGVIADESVHSSKDPWPDYRSLPPRPDADRDGLPDAWETLFGLDPVHASDSLMPARDGYAFLEHYLNNTSPVEADDPKHRPIVHIRTEQSRASVASPGVIIIEAPDGNIHAVKHQLSAGTKLNAVAIQTIESGDKKSLRIEVRPTRPDAGEQSIVVELQPGPAYVAGCPAEAMVVTR